MQVQVKTLPVQMLTLTSIDRSGARGEKPIERAIAPTRKKREKAGAGSSFSSRHNPSFRTQQLESELDTFPRLSRIYGVFGTCDLIPQ